MGKGVAGLLNVTLLMLTFTAECRQTISAAEGNALESRLLQAGCQP